MRENKLLKDGDHNDISTNYARDPLYLPPLSPAFLYCIELVEPTRKYSILTVPTCFAGTHLPYLIRAGLLYL